MDSISDAELGRAPNPSITLPTTLAEGATVLLVGPFDPSEHALPLRLLAEYGTSNDTALVVTTRESASATVETWEQVSTRGVRPSLGIVDTASEKQSIAATYEEVPTFFTPSSGDLERIVMALSELTETMSWTRGSRHLVFRSLTPILQEAPTERVCRVIERVSGLRTGSGLGLFGIDISAHDRTTLGAIADTVDGVVWINRTETGQFETEFNPRRAHVPF